jgi:hypothetical protein
LALINALENINVPTTKLGPGGKVPSPINSPMAEYLKSKSRPKSVVFNKAPKGGTRKKIHKMFKQKLDSTGKSKKSVYK